MFKPFDLQEITNTQYIFFTGKGGVGKTSLSVGLSNALAKLGSSVTLLDADLRLGVVLGGED